MDVCQIKPAILTVALYCLLYPFPLFFFLLLYCLSYWLKDISIKRTIIGDYFCYAFKDIFFLFLWKHPARRYYLLFKFLIMQFITCDKPCNISVSKEKVIKVL